MLQPREEGELQQPRTAPRLGQTEKVRARDEGRRKSPQLPTDMGMSPQEAGATREAGALGWGISRASCTHSFTHPITAPVPCLCLFYALATAVTSLHSSGNRKMRIKQIRKIHGSRKEELK